MYGLPKLIYTKKYLAKINAGDNFVMSQHWQGISEWREGLQSALLSIKDQLTKLSPPDVPNLSQLEESSRRAQQYMISLNKDLLKVKEESLAIKEENLSLRQRIWEFEKESLSVPQSEKEEVRRNGDKERRVYGFDDRIGSPSAAVVVSERPPLQEVNDGELITSAEKVQYLEKILIKTQKWAKRRFHKTEFFLRELRNKGYKNDLFESLVRRLKEWAKAKPWFPRIDELLMISSGRGTSTPFSHYSSFDSEVQECIDADDINLLPSPSGGVVKDIGISPVQPNSQNGQSKSERTNNISKSCFSKSLSVLDRAKKLFANSVEEGSNLSRKQDVKMTDVLPNQNSDIKDVACN